MPLPSTIEATARNSVMSDAVTDEPSCPVCDEPVPPRDENDAFPFCSKRCREIDLGRWLDEQYSIPMTADSTERTMPEASDDEDE
jgi:hypothetical protein